MRNYCSFTLSAFALACLSGCASQTLFRSDFDATPVGQPPAAVQAVGRASVHGPAGSVVVAAAPGQSEGKWVRIARPNGSQTAGFQGKFAEFKGDGELCSLRRQRRAGRSEGSMPQRAVTPLVGS